MGVCAAPLERGSQGLWCAARFSYEWTVVIGFLSSPRGNPFFLFLLFVPAGVRRFFFLREAYFSEDERVSR